MVAALSVKISTVQPCGQVIKAVNIAMVSALVEDGKFSRAAENFTLGASIFD
jgi:hypothetical protein